jgi:hypothetical protein
MGAMKRLLVAATVSFGVIGAAHAQENPMARPAPMISTCSGNALGTRTSYMGDGSYMGEAAAPTDPTLCPGFLDGSVVHLPHHDLRT